MKEWLYTTSFSLGGVFEHAQHFEIVFEGLDTFADVYLVSFIDSERVITDVKWLRIDFST